MVSAENDELQRIEDNLSEKSTKSSQSPSFESHSYFDVITPNDKATQWNLEEVDSNESTLELRAQ